MRKQFIIFALLIFILELFIWKYWPNGLWSLVVVAPLLLLGFYDITQRKHAILRNFPILGWARFIMETLRPKIQQYFVESDIDGRPIGRIFRSLVYQRAKGEVDTTPFGTQLNVNEVGYEWMNHSINAISLDDIKDDLRINIGGPDCKKPYNCSVFNISAMSFGSLSNTAILALNKGAKIGNFAHNTGEGGISSYHLENGGDLIWQIGTGYFGCRDNSGTFCSKTFQKNATKESVKMIELKLSQGAKPGHGGILPAKKNTPEIAKIRGVQPYEDIISPPYHTSFKTPLELLSFIKNLRELSDGKPVGFKLCVGSRSEFISICKAMVESKIYPDFITVDGGEGGTGAAPLEYSNSIGMPLTDGLSFVSDCLNGFDLKKHIKIIASGKIITGFNALRNIALGADMVSSARAMMMALGCIQALECNKNICPTGVATQNPELAKGLDVMDKSQRVYRYHRETINSIADLLSATGHKSLNSINRSDIFRRINYLDIMRFNEIYPDINNGDFLENKIPTYLKLDFERSQSNQF